MICIERNLINELIDFLNGNMLENKRRNIAACSCLESVTGILIPLNLLRLESLIACKEAFALSLVVGVHNIDVKRNLFAVGRLNGNIICTYITAVINDCAVGI